MLTLECVGPFNDWRMSCWNLRVLEDFNMTPHNAIYRARFCFCFFLFWMIVKQSTEFLVTCWEKCVGKCIKNMWQTCEKLSKRDAKCMWHSQAALPQIGQLTSLVESIDALFNMKHKNVHRERLYYIESSRIEWQSRVYLKFLIFS